MLLKKVRKNLRAFTLVELLVVIGVLAILLAITLVAINPTRQFAKANDSKRRSDVNAILNAVNQYTVRNRGTLPGTINTTATAISNTGTNLCPHLVPGYIAAIPSDPQTGTGAGANGANITNCAAAYNTGYTIMRAGANNRITVSATGQVTNPITATR